MREHAYLDPSIARLIGVNDPATRSPVKRLLGRIGKTDQVRADPTLSDARGPNIRELRRIQRARARCTGR